MGGHSEAPHRGRHRVGPLKGTNAGSLDGACARGPRPAPWRPVIRPSGRRRRRPVSNAARGPRYGVPCAGEKNGIRVVAGAPTTPTDVNPRGCHPTSRPLSRAPPAAGRARRAAARDTTPPRTQYRRYGAPPSQRRSGAIMPYPSPPACSSRPSRPVVGGVPRQPPPAVDATESAARPVRPPAWTRASALPVTTHEGTSRVPLAQRRLATQHGL
ncbi:hypothetical protein PSP31121_05323 [Pandoraea sputorum]|uniref:Uncharacterized protein n=1 Tax=Pandoraea sputorum TaxID=93222 RepID=A0A5E5BMS7_9BURK|nr:hypothetical protein PSP31121_05323 [Pandoraea sputorum]